MQSQTGETQSVPFDAAQIGYDATVEALRKLLAERFGMSPEPEGIPQGDPLFAVGLGLSSLEGIEFLCEVEKQFNLRITDLEWWVYETPTLANVANYLIELSKKQHGTA